LNNEIESCRESESDDVNEKLLHVSRCGTLNVQEVYSDKDENTNDAVTCTGDGGENPDTVIISDDE